MLALVTLIAKALLDMRHPELRAISAERAKVRHHRIGELDFTAGTRVDGLQRREDLRREHVVRAAGLRLADQLHRGVDVCRRRLARAHLHKGGAKRRGLAGCRGHASTPWFRSGSSLPSCSSS